MAGVMGVPNVNTANAMTDTWRYVGDIPNSTEAFGDAAWETLEELQIVTRPVA